MLMPISLTEPQGLVYCYEAAKMAGPFVLNKRYTVNMPPGTISDSGKEQINAYIDSQYPKRSPEWQASNKENEVVTLQPLPDDWAWVWIVKDKKHPHGVGKFTTRLEKYIKKTMSLKCPDKFMENIGTLARDNSSEDISFYFDFVDRIDWDDGDFGDDDSCWWGSYSDAPDTLIDNGGLAVRFFTDAKQDIGIGRAWLAPYSDMYVLFNGYGFDNATLLITKLVAQHLGHSYKKVGLENHNDLMYINNDSGFLIGLPDHIKPCNNVGLEFGDMVISCDHCDCDMGEDEYEITPNGSRYCHDCFNEHYATCPCCDEVKDRDDMTEVDCGDLVCDRCLGRNYTSCDECSAYHADEDITHVDGADYCDSCLDSECAECSKCNEWRHNDHIVDSDPIICDDCQPEKEEEE